MSDSNYEDKTVEELLDIAYEQLKVLEKGAIKLRAAFDLAIQTLREMPHGPGCEYRPGAPRTSCTCWKIEFEKKMEQL